MWRLTRKRIRTCCNVVTLYGTLNEKTTTTVWNILPRAESDGWEWKSIPTVLYAHMSNVVTRNLFNTYKYKMLKKIVITLRQVGRAYDVQQDMTITGEPSKSKINGKISTLRSTLMPGKDLSFTQKKLEEEKIIITST
ncbi:hypothetical protein HNY73_003128 [Argiope bruennichi]|uniref:Uncharacterized protein n=1 Tax=Argiope bruennichi TaxID=94029 RepID=A0A8T0FVW7_ARGBR|nr:hypothetical protein HNY73_003128 [Argiope bruennichi]